MPRSRVQSKGARWRSRRSDSFAELVAERSDDADLIDLAGWICDGTECQEEVDGVQLRPDGGHFTPESSPLAGAFLTGELERIAAERGLGPDAEQGTESASAEDPAAPDGG